MRGTHCTELKDGGIVLMILSKNLSTTVLGGEELLLFVGGKVRGRMPKKKSVQSSITCMGFRV